MYEHLVTSVDAKVDEQNLDIVYRSVEGREAHQVFSIEAIGALEIWLDQVRRKAISDRREDLEKLTSRLKNGRRVYRLE